MDANLRRKLGQGLKPLVKTRDVNERKNLLGAIEMCACRTFTKHWEDLYF